MKNKYPSTDGFVPRQPGDQLGGLHNDKKKHRSKDKSPENKLLHTASEGTVFELEQQVSSHDIFRTDIEKSLDSIDAEKVEPAKKLSRKQRRLMKKLAKKPKSKFRRVIKWVLIVLLIALLAVGGYVFYKFSNASNNVFEGTIFDVFQTQALKQDSNGRSNFLILGTSEDDPGHDASYLTDSIMIVSVDQTNKNVYMFSVPRDLEVHYGMACISGYSGKINEYFSCTNDGTDADAEQDRLTKTQAFIGEIFGIDIQYGVHVNYTVMRDVINALGGSITITIESRDPRGQMDSNADWKCGATYTARIKNCPPSGHYIDYPNGEVTIDAEHALYLAMARGDIAPTYGLENSNFDREINQQKIIVAIRDKAMSTGTLTNLSAITKLVEALGNNLRTNIQTSEIRTLMKVTSETQSNNIHSLNLFVDGIMSGNGNPMAGKYIYTDIQEYIAKNLDSNPVVREAAPIVVLNGSGTAGLGQSKADDLEAAKYTIASVGTAPDGTYEAVEVYQIGDGNTGTAAALASLYGVTIKTATPPVTVNGNVRFVIIFGAVATN